MEEAEFQATFRLEESHWWFVGMRRITDALLRSPPAPRGRVLDVGCGTGGNFPFLGRYGEVLGLDVAAYALRLGRSRSPQADLAQGSATALPFRDGSFDMVASFDVLSQLAPGSEGAALGEFRRVLKEGGRLALRVPACQWLHSRHDRVLHTYHRYSLGELKGKLAAAGFRVGRATYANTFLFPLIAARRLLYKLPLGGGRSDLVPVPGPVNRALLALLSLEAAAVGRFGLPFGLSAMVVARKG